MMMKTFTMRSPPLSQRKRLKIVVSSGEVDLLGESVDEELEQNREEIPDHKGQNTELPGPQRDCGPPIEGIMKEASPGLIPEQDD